MTIKNCTTCKEDKPLEDYHKQKQGAYGRQARCRVCTKEYTVAKRSASGIKARNVYTKESKLASKAKWRANNKEAIRQSTSEYKKKNRASILADTRKRQLGKINRTPHWLTKEDYATMKALYIQCARITKETGIQHHVDHIVPLHGENVSGLHVPSNLQILTAEANLSKGNTYEG